MGWTRTGAWVLLACLLISTTACSPSGPKLEPPAQAVQQLLELRSVNATDRAEYLRYVESTSVAAALAADSIARKNNSPVPEWETPQVTESGTSTAEVKVIWKPSEQFKDWPASTMFGLTKGDAGWRVVDAVDTTATAK